MTRYYLAIDIETEGDSFDNGLIAIGAAFGPANGSWASKDLLVFSGYLEPLPGQFPDPNTVKDFWLKNKKVYNHIKSNARPAVEVMTEFLAFCESLVSKYEKNPDDKIEILTDCADFDLGRLHVLGCIQTHVWTQSIRWLGGNKRRIQLDPRERLKVLTELQDSNDRVNLNKQCDKWITLRAPEVIYDHDPCNDAKHCYWQMIYINTQLSVSRAHLFKEIVH